MSSKTVASEGRPKTLHGSRSFTRMEVASSNSSPRKRASTLQPARIAAIPEARHIDSLPYVSDEASIKADPFENGDGDEDEDMAGESQSNGDVKSVDTKGHDSLDELPIEIKSLTERFLGGLFAKVHPAPLTADNLSDMFQDFYEQASSQISVHIATLASRIGRADSSTVPSGRNALKGRPRAGSGPKRGDSPGHNSGGEMLTASEVADRKKARRMLELKRVSLEEAVERGICEKVYDRIYKHRSTDDEARDEKLRSKAAALSVVGIGLKELHMDDDPAKDNVRRTTEEKEEEISESLAAAREALQRMDDAHYPLGKLQHLTAAHKSIVETLSQIYPSSSSADEILPTLIYTLITAPPEGVNAVSNLSFIQRFRASNKVDGEAAYCLVNLEAAISFLETVDLSSLRADELPEGPAKSSSRPETPTQDKVPHPMASLSPKAELSPISVMSTDKSSPDTSSKPLPLPSNGTTSDAPRPGLQPRRISNMMQMQANRLEAGRENILNAADKVYDSINGTLDNSLAFVFGRFKDQIGNKMDSSPLPKTLEDARKLVSTPAATPDEDESMILNMSGDSTPTHSEDPLSASSAAKRASVSSTTSSISENKMLELLGGRKPFPRDRSVDSTKSVESGKRIVFDAAGKSKEQQQQPQHHQQQHKEEPLGAAAANFITSINPLNRFGVPGFGRFGRSVSVGTGAAPPTTIQASPPSEANRVTSLGNIPESPSTSTAGEEKANGVQNNVSGHVSDAGDDLNAIEALAELRKIKPPRKRFLDVSSASELKLGEVQELLLEYRRLAKAIGEAIST